MSAEKNNGNNFIDSKDLDLHTNWTIVHKYCHTMLTIVLTQICEHNQLKFIFLSVYMEMANVDGTSYNICMTCYDTFHKNKPTTVHCEERCYFYAKDAQRFNQSSRCVLCRIYYTKMTGKPLDQFSYGVNEELQLIVTSFDSSRIMEIMAMAYHY